jgi:hypothetical protein
MIGVAGESYPLATSRYQSDQLPRSQFLANSRLADDSESFTYDQTVGIVPPSMM